MVRTRRRSRTKDGFTLIELLVVIAIIAILAAILFPVFAKARARANLTTCTSNLRQIGLALSNYATDYDGLYPPTWRVYLTRDTPQRPEKRGWENNVYAYIKSWDVFTCPELKYKHSYIRNEWAGEATQDPKGDPTRVIHVFDVPRYPTDGANRFRFGTFNDSLRQSDDADWSNDAQYSPQMTTQQIDDNTSMRVQGLPYWLRFPGPHQGKSDILFLDGHVRAFSAWDPNQMTFQWGTRTTLIWRQ